MFSTFKSITISFRMIFEGAFFQCKQPRNNNYPTAAKGTRGGGNEIERRDSFNGNNEDKTARTDRRQSRVSSSGNCLIVFALWFHSVTAFGSRKIFRTPDRRACLLTCVWVCRKLQRSVILVRAVKTKRGKANRKKRRRIVYRTHSNWMLLWSLLYKICFDILKNYSITSQGSC